MRSGWRLSVVVAVLFGTSLLPAVAAARPSFTGGAPRARRIAELSPSATAGARVSASRLSSSPAAARAGATFRLGGVLIDDGAGSARVRDNPLPLACTPELASTNPNHIDSMDGTQCPANKLVITTATPIAAGSQFVVQVNYTGRPGVHHDGDGTTEGWFRNDRPSDAAAS